MAETEICLAALLFLGNGISDLRSRQISLRYTAALAGLGLIYRVMQGLEWRPVIWALLPGAGLILFSFLSRGKVGMGDGIVLAASAVCLSLTELLIVFSVGIMLMSLPAACLMIRRGIISPGRREKVPPGRRELLSTERRGSDSSGRTEMVLSGRRKDISPPGSEKRRCDSLPFVPFLFIALMLYAYGLKT